jgi:two-component system sensor histidine kinase GlrK
VVVVSLALATVLGALVRMTQLARALGEHELGALASEGALHQTAWTLDLALRGALDVCDGGTPSDARTRIARARDGLVERLEATPHASPSIAHAAGRYVALAGRALAGEPCATMRGHPEIEEERTELDALLTTVWVDRLAELHAAAREREAEADELGTWATGVGTLLAASAFLLATLVARRMAREISQPLRELGDTAQRLARGDFGERVVIEGPAEIVALAEELERMRSRLAELEMLKQGFLGSVSHELRTPLSKIREALTLLNDGAVGKLDERQLRVVSIARAACEREVRLVSTLLDFSRLRAGTPLQRRDGSSIDEVLQTAVAEEAADARARRVEVDLTREGDAPRTSLDTAMVERALANLVRNAVSVSRPGQRVRVVRDLVMDDGVWTAKVRVSDDGPGVPSEIRETIFQPFVTRAVELSPKSVGVGLGLALAREVALAHGGDLAIEDGTSGASFVLTLPLPSAARTG